MKIPREKQISFLQKVISDTMNGKMLWSRMISNCIAASNVFSDIPLDAEGVFSCRFDAPTEGELWIAMGQDGQVRGAIGIETNHMEHFSHANEEISVLLTRLFYLLFDARPSANQLIDAFLSQDSPQAPGSSE